MRIDPTRNHELLRLGLLQMMFLIVCLNPLQHLAQAVILQLTMKFLVRLKDTNPSANPKSK